MAVVRALIYADFNKMNESFIHKTLWIGWLLLYNSMRINFHDNDIFAMQLENKGSMCLNITKMSLKTLMCEIHPK